MCAKVSSLLGVIVGLSVGGVFAAAAPGNCKSQAVPLRAGVQLSVQTVREWDENRISTTFVWNEATQSFDQQITYGGWTFGDDSTPLSEQQGVYWMSATLTNGNDYVISMELENGLMISRSDDRALNKLSQVTDKGKSYFFIRKEEWLKGEESATYYFRVFGQVGSINKKGFVILQEKSIDEVVELLGTRAKPIELGEIAEQGTVVISSAPEKVNDRLTTVYSAILQPNIPYSFTVDDAVGDVDMFVDLPSETWELIDQGKFPGTVSATWNGVSRIERTAITKLDIEVEEKTTVVLYISPDRVHPDTSVAGRTLSWGGATVEPTNAGMYVRTLEAMDEPGVFAGFNVVAKLMSDGSTNFSATVAFEGGRYDFVDADGEILGPNGSNFEVGLNPGSESLYVDGSLILKSGREIFFAGDLPGNLILWNDSFLQFTGLKSAADMGITCLAFRNDQAADLIDLRAWASLNNVTISRINGEALFTPTGDPYGLLTEAYLLGCSPTEAAVAEEMAKFVITKFDPVNGVEVAGGVKDGGAYGNGKVQVRTSVKVVGTYDISSKGSPDSLFYRAYLVK